MRRLIIIIIAVIAAAAVMFFVRNNRNSITSSTAREFEGAAPKPGATYCTYTILEVKRDPKIPSDVGQPFAVNDQLCVRCCSSKNCSEFMDIVSGDGFFTYVCRRTGGLTCSGCPVANGYYGCK